MLMIPVNTRRVCNVRSHAARIQYIDIILIKVIVIFAIIRIYPRFKHATSSVTNEALDWYPKAVTKPTIMTPTNCFKFPMYNFYLNNV